MKLNELIYLDRSLCNESKENLIYLKKIQKKIYEFLKQNKINLIIGEFTWAHEILTYRISINYNDINSIYLNIGDIRILPNNFLFFTDPSQKNYYKRKEISIIKNQNINFLEYNKYIKKNKKLKNIFNLKIVLKKFLKILLKDYFDKYDPTATSKFKRISRSFFKIYNYIMIKCFLKNYNDFHTKKYVLYFLQKKPEASIDVKGQYYDDQIKNIEMIWKILPSNFNLIVKEHPSCIGENSLSFYKKISKYNKIYISISNNNAKEILENSYCTFGVSTTASMESACLGIPSFTFADCFFNELNFCYRITLEDIKNSKNLENLIKNFTNLDKKIVDEQFDFIKNSFKGSMYGDKMYEKENIKNISNAISEICNQK